MNDDKPASAAPDGPLAGNTGDSSKGHVAAQVDRVSELHPVSLDTHLSRGDRNDEVEHERERSS